MFLRLLLLMELTRSLVHGRRMLRIPVLGWSESKLYSTSIPWNFGYRFANI